MTSICRKALVPAALMAALTISQYAGAASLPVANPSLESPVVDTTFLPVSLAVTGWATAGPSGDVDVDGPGPDPARNSGTGTFPNPASGPSRFTNARGNQLAYIFTTTGEEFQQTLAGGFQTISGDNVYGVTVAVGNATAAPAPTDQLLIQLFYTVGNDSPLDPTKRVFVATRAVRNDAADGLSGTALKDFSAFSAPILPGSPAAGRSINVLISTIGAGGTQFDFDDVRVTSVPEPGVALALAVGMPAVAGLRRRRRRQCVR